MIYLYVFAAWLAFNLALFLVLLYRRPAPTFRQRLLALVVDDT